MYTLVRNYPSPFSQLPFHERPSSIIRKERRPTRRDPPAVFHRIIHRVEWGGGKWVKVSPRGENSFRTFRTRLLLQPGMFTTRFISDKAPRPSAPFANCESKQQ